ncbi:hypothetical protein tb265_49800 [Gemmatimonadetes bacterium T265]|nr:hypothetical protein tb265_49800 [Gemmatimonadetes bacterium T265]
MATPRANELFQKITDDVAFRQSLENAASPEERRAIIDAAGYSDVSKEDAQAAVAEHTGSSELSDAELEAVAGGQTTTWLSFITAVTLLAVA